MKLNVKALAISLGLFWGLSVLLMTWWMIFVWHSNGAPTFLAHFYLGYNLSPLGSLIGFVWAFVDGFIAGAIFGVIYNFFASRMTGAGQA